MKTFKDCLTLIENRRDDASADRYLLNDELCEIFKQHNTSGDLIFAVSPEYGVFIGSSDTVLDYVSDYLVPIAMFLLNKTTEDYAPYYDVIIDKLLEEGHPFSCRLWPDTKYVHCRLGLVNLDLNKYYFNDRHGLLIKKEWENFIIVP